LNVPAPDSVLTSAWLAFLTPLMLAVLTMVNLLSTRMTAQRAKLIAEKVTTVAKVAAEAVAHADVQTGKILVLAEKTHTLVNSQYGIALALILAKAQRIAALSNDPADIEEVEKAKKKLAEHEAKQHVVDTEALR